MVKGIEDIVFYWWFWFVGFNEVGGNFEYFGVVFEELYVFFGWL